MTRFRMSIAFNSLWKLIILSVMTALTMSALVFGISVSGQFDASLASTYESRNYSYAIDLYSPTSQGGQYQAVQFDEFGKSG